MKNGPGAREHSDSRFFSRRTGSSTASLVVSFSHLPPPLTGTRVRNRRRKARRRSGKARLLQNRYGTRTTGRNCCVYNMVATLTESVEVYNMQSINGSKKQAVKPAASEMRQKVSPAPAPETASIAQLPPTSLIPHEPTNPTHLALLLTYLSSIPPETPVPLPVVTKSFPHVILDGHHRVAAACALNLRTIPVWVVDDEVESEDVQVVVADEVRCFDTKCGERVLLKTVATLARSGVNVFGVKGTRHVVCGPSGDIRLLEEVTPRLAWQKWIMDGSGGVLSADPLR